MSFVNWFAIVGVFYIGARKQKQANNTALAHATLVTELSSGAPNFACF